MLFFNTILLFFFISTILSSKSDNWALIVSTSRFWFNYRHSGNALSVYRSVKRLGIPDSQIILMLADEFACNARNPYPGKIYSNKDKSLDVYGQSVEVDYRGEDVTVENVLRVLTDRVKEGTPSSKRLLTGQNSNLLIYFSGHGGEDFVKFQEQEELTSDDFADALYQMHLNKRYNEILVISDSCQAQTLYNKIHSPNIIAISSSKLGEDALSHHSDRDTGVYVIDRYTYYLLEFIEKIANKKTLEEKLKYKMKDLQKICPKNLCISTTTYDVFDFRGGENLTDEIPVLDFFGGHRKISKKEAKFVDTDQEFLQKLTADSRIENYSF